MATYKKINELDEAAKRLNAARNAVQDMSYDSFKAGDMYKGLQRDFQQGGQMAMKDTLGQVAARTGGIASSYATSAANQSYNNYMQGLENAARSMFNEEYSRAKDKYNMALGEYDKAYDEYRDTKADNEQAKKDEMDMLSSDAYYGDVGLYEDYRKKHPNTMLTETEFTSLVNAARGLRTDDNRETVDAELKALLAAEGFNWDDWIKDGKNDTTDVAPNFGESSFGEDYWKQYWAEAQRGYTDEAAEEEMFAAVNDIEARIANGESLEDIASYYNITDDADWKAVTGMSKAEWTKIANDTKKEQYRYAPTEAGASEIFSKLTNSASRSLSEEDQKNFDYIFGDGAYSTTKKVMEEVEKLQPPKVLYDIQQGEYRAERRYDDLDARIDEIIDELVASVQGITDEQIYAIFDAINPDVMKYYFSA
jgi:hypothetical protein